MRVGHLHAGHKLDIFDRGNKELNHWLRTYALENDQRNLSRTFILVDENDEVIGYYSLTMGGVTKQALPKKYGRGLPGYDIGMVLLGRLAIALEHHGHGYGRDLMIDAIKSAARAGDHAAARFIAVDPIDDAARAFYARFSFRDVDGDPLGRMFLRVEEALEIMKGR